MEQESEPLRKPFRIVHLSDLHLTRTEGARRTELGVFQPLKGMNRAFRAILAAKPVRQADLILVTGDVTDRGDRIAWELFWEAITDAGLIGRCFVLPGNHDVCCLGVRLPDHRGEYRREDLRKAAVGLRLGDQPTAFPAVVTPDPRIAVFGLNSNNLGNLNVATNALGELGYYQLKSLAGKLHLHRHVPVKIVALHHSPNIPGPETARKRGQPPMSALDRLGHQIPQDQRRALLLLCIAHRVRLVVHGHLHLAESRTVSGIRIIGAPATTEPIMAKNPPGGYQFCRYSVLGSGGRVKSELLTVTA